MYKIRLPNFEGPFDLLLYFIKRDEINIYDIPISRITGEFLKYIRLMQYFDLELAGEFLVMAANLMYIKTQMLLPKTINEETGEIEDPRTQLVQKLLEYKQIKEAASDLSKLAEDQKYVYYRNAFQADEQLIASQTEKSFINANLFDLLKAFQKAIARADENTDTEHIVNIIAVTVEDKTKDILYTLKHKKRVTFSQITEKLPKPIIIVTFLALLELIKQNSIAIIQDEVFDEIIIMENLNFSLN